ncbi:MAG: ribosomal-processing cysteine protease Prp [Bacilli bacterium]|jgi:uncharacterized protein YsxB (DUF464 family)|nr:ribosomal-processing cysteine protease Prp [Bacilli bacterium]
MILVEVTRNVTNEIVAVTVSGHANYDVKGQDIVCSAVSTATYVSIGLLNKMKVQHKFAEDGNKPEMKITVQPTVLSSQILENLIDTFTGIQIEYSKFIKIIEKRR